MVETQFISKDQPGQVMNKLRRLYSRARPEAQELNILRGVLTAIEKKLWTKNNHFRCKDEYLTILVK